ncbi:CCA tRNA nucleotidyltransferase [Consotaella salsifontis]|uniref:Poly(A) polymerase n=1 Tax=Consotaella salsifontis TaxID=1365950 RepID=A0A1T4NW97_9HYPH|nr:CCA tRNA nucleotidyltransferase [Consotaella salsifontis]SJZ83475.1 poly(A) polymerase [Consotaella salsifontis]
MSTQRIEADWLKDEALQRLLLALSDGGEAARVVGGAVRNTLLGLAVTDVDIATTTLPEQSSERARAAGFKVVPTGIDHGTVTVVADGRGYEVTTLRRDIATDGRHATVSFGRDWRADAERRDFTMNALYCEASGEVIDLVGGLEDLSARRVRFIGDADQRIAEDYLRILRFFRFFAWYGEGRPDAAGLKAVTRLRGGMKRLSVERVWAELKKLLAAPDPSRALLWMRQTGVLTEALPETEKWGIDAIPGLIAAEADLGWKADAMLRLAAIVPPDAARLAAMAQRLRFSNADRDRLLAFANAEAPRPDESEAVFRARLYFGDRTAIVDRLRLALAGTRVKAAEDMAKLAEVAALHRMLTTAEKFSPPAFPLSGNDLLASGVSAGPVLGETLKRLTRIWVDSGFVLGKKSLLERL